MHVRDSAIKNMNVTRLKDIFGTYEAAAIAISEVSGAKLTGTAVRHWSVCGKFPNQWLLATKHAIERKQQECAQALNEVQDAITTNKNGGAAQS